MPTPGAEFLGFLILQNRIKPESPGVIKELRDAEIRTLMVTGDNILTAISVSMECGILKPKEKVYIAEISDEGKIVWRQNLMSTQLESIPVEDFSIAMTGSTFSWIADKKPSILPYLIVKGAVFARMSPDQKAELGRIYTLNVIVSLHISKTS